MDNEQLVMILRLALAGALGALIGLEREYRAKEAGMRTHFLVALGSSLIMLVSQYGFGDKCADASRVAAQIVSGIGFIGAGTIMMNKQIVRGLTTAAGLWVAAGIGMAIGGGLYVIGAVTTVFTLIGLELFQVLFQRFHAQTINLVFTAADCADLVKITDMLNKNNYRVEKYSVTGCCSENTASGIKVEMRLLGHDHNNDGAYLMKLMQNLPGINIEKLE